MSPPVQELPTPHKPPSHVIANPVRTPGVAISCRNYRLHTNSFVRTVCRFAVGGDMSPPYKSGPNGKD